MERRKFIRNEIDETLKTVSKAFTSKSECYIIGGLAMMHHGVKLATKDVDIVFRSSGTTLRFVRTLERLGFQDESPGRARGKKRKNFWKMEGPGEMRFDVFSLTVCNCLVVSKNMALRAVEYPMMGGRVNGSSPRIGAVFLSDK